MGTCIYEKYPPNYNFRGAKVLNLGCGTAQYKFPNVVNLDAYGKCDVLHNLEEKPLPFKDETFDLVIANHILEHLHNWWGCFNEAARVVKTGGIIEVHVPGDGAAGQMGYRDHVSLINGYSFFGTASFQRPGTNAWAEVNRGEPAARLSMVASGTGLHNAWWIKYAPKKLQVWMAEHLRNIVGEQSFWFKKLSDSELKSIKLEPMKR